MLCNAKNLAVVLPHQFLERCHIALPRPFDERYVRMNFSRSL
jgi:hypothetical protein